MIVELAIFLTSLGATALLVVLAVRGYRLCRWGRVGFAAIGIGGLQLAGSILFGPQMRGYLYRGADSHVTFLECPFKGVSYESMLARYRATSSGTPLFRTFNQDWWNFYRWHDYLHHPRWKLPYRPVGEPNKSVQATAAAPSVSSGVGNSPLPGFVVAQAQAAVPDLVR